MSIWDFKELRKEVDEGNVITLQEGNTPTNKFKFENIEVIIKREDQNPTGSWKDRATAYKLTKLLSEGVHEGVISTSGNAAISYWSYIKKLNLNFKLYVVVKNDINQEKQELLIRLLDKNTEAFYRDFNPKKKAVQISVEKNIPNLKSAVDEDALKGYWSLGIELTEFLNRQESNQDVLIFCPASSGSGFVGLSQGLFMKLGNEFFMPKLFVCQTEKVHPFYDSLNNQSTVSSESESLADAIIDSSGLRSPQVLKIIKECNGDILKITNDELIETEKFVKSKDINDLSYNSLLSIAGFLKVKENYNPKKVICIASGR